LGCCLSTNRVFKWHHLIPISLFLLYGSNNVLFFDRHDYE
jgi:hypothetical protein